MRGLAIRARRFDLQRLFSGFPNGAAGWGLLLLRSTVGIALAAGGARSLDEASAAFWTGATGALAILCGCALLSGTLTPAAGLLAAALSLVREVVPPPARPDGLADGASLALLLAMGVSVALLGPGAFSVDAWLFGRREIVVPRARPQDASRRKANPIG